MFRYYIPMVIFVLIPLLGVGFVFYGVYSLLYFLYSPSVDCSVIRSAEACLCLA